MDKISFAKLSLETPICIMPLNLRVGTAKTNSTLGPALGQYGIKGIDLCNSFNVESLKYYKKDSFIKVFVFIFSDRTFKLYFKMPPVNYLLKIVSQDNIIFSRDLYKVCLVLSENVKHLPRRTIFKNLLNSLHNYNYEIRS